MSQEKIAVIEDEKLIRWSLKSRLEKNGFFVFEAMNGREGISLIRNEDIDLVLLDHKLPDIDGSKVLKEIRQFNLDTPVIMMTAFASVENAIEAIKNGAYDYIHKPFEFEELLILIKKALEATAIKREVERVRKEQEKIYGIKNIIGKSEEMQKVFDFINKIAPSPASTIFIKGESGTGKKNIATAIHFLSDRAHQPFLSTICSSSTEPSLETELFGKETDRVNGKEVKKGLLELAQEGTLFIEEIGYSTPSFQQTLLRVLEEKRVRRINGTSDIPLKCRIIFSSSRSNIKELCEAGAFLKELYDKLSLISIEVPPLRKRKNDIPLLVNYFIDNFNKEFKKHFKGIKKDALDLLLSYEWHGNVRELKNLIERIMIVEDKEFIEKSDLPDEIIGKNLVVSDEVNFYLPIQGIRLEDVEKNFILQALERTEGNQTKASRLLGLTRDTLRYRMKKFKIKV